MIRSNAVVPQNRAGYAAQSSQLQQALLSAQPQATIRPPGQSTVPPISSIVQGLKQPPPTGPPIGKQLQNPQPTIATGIKPPASAPGQAPAAPGVNPYTGKPLAANEYVGVAGSEADHPGMVRIPPPGWWDPSNPNYERRAYYRDKGGNIVAIENGYQGDAEHPYDTGREGERNTEMGRSGEGIIRMSQPGLPTWGPGQERPKPTPLPAAGQAPPAASGAPPDPLDMRAGLRASGQSALDPGGQLMALIRALMAKNPNAQYPVQG